MIIPLKDAAAPPVGAIKPVIMGKPRLLGLEQYLIDLTK
jgi:hypothetical protein